MRSGVPPDAGKAQESLLEAVVVILGELDSYRGRGNSRGTVRIRVFPVSHAPSGTLFTPSPGWAIIAPNTESPESTGSRRRAP